MYAEEKPLNEIFAENLKLQMRIHGFSTRALGEKIGVSAMTVSNWQRGVFSPNPDMMDKICKALGVSRNELLSDRESISNLSIPAARPLPILGQICAGNGTLAEQNFDGYFFVDNSIRADYTLHVTGDSMIDAGIHHGDIAFIKKSYDYCDGRIYAVLLPEDDHAVLKRVFRQEDGLLLLPCNPKYSPILSKDAFVIGELIGTYHPI